MSEPDRDPDATPAPAGPCAPPTLPALTAWLVACGCGPGDVHTARLLRRWTHARPLTAGRQAAEHSLPLALRQSLPAVEQGLDGLARVVSRHPAPDGSERLLMALHDGATVEAVLLPRGGLCVSTQVGCAVGCVFCMTGQGGLLRQLGSAEIVAQVAQARRLRAVRKVVFMGMGEPAHNLQAVLEAIELLGTLGGIGHKQLVFSTVGDDRAFDRLMALPPGQVRPALALSLHTTQAALRRRLLPRAAPLSPEALVEAAERYARATAYPVQVQWALMAGVNDSDDEVDQLARLLQGRLMMLNLIPYNAVPGLPWQRPTLDRAVEMTRALNRRGVLTRLRWSAAQEVEGGCGQLRARAAAMGDSPTAVAASDLPARPVSPPRPGFRPVLVRPG